MYHLFRYEFLFLIDGIKLFYLTIQEIASVSNSMGILPTYRCLDQIQTIREVNRRVQREPNIPTVKNATHIPLEEYLKSNIISHQSRQRSKKQIG